MKREVDLNSIDSIDQAPLIDRAPIGLYKWLDSLWKKHFGTEPFSTRKRGTDYKIPEEYGRYCDNLLSFMIALEELFRVGLITQENLFNKEGRMRRNLTSEDLLSFTEGKPLRGLSICVIGGPEGRVFAEMGANVVGVDPFIDRAPPIKGLPNLREIAGFFSHKLIEEQKLNPFLLTFSCWLLDRGSGLDPIFRIAFIEPDEKEKRIYKDFLQLIINITQPGGLSIHNGDMIGRVAEKIEGVESIRAYRRFPDDDLTANGTIYVFRRKQVK